MSPALVDNSLRATVDVISGMSDEPDWWDLGYGDVGGVFTGDWWKAPSDRVADFDRGLAERVTKTFDLAEWAKYENGKIPLSAMVRVGTEASGARAYLRPDAAAAWQRVVQAAALEGVTLTLTDSYRTFDQQVEAERTKPALAATPGTSNHGLGIAVDIGEGEQRDWLSANGHRFGWKVLPSESWHFDYVGGGEGIVQEVDPSARKEQAASRRGLIGQHDTTLVPASLGSRPYLADIAYGVMSDMRNDVRPRDRATDFKGPDARVKQQLYDGFVDAGRPDLARMVRTRAFSTWIRAESGWNPRVVSAYFGGHGRNAGLFQFALLDREWVWDDVDTSEWTYGATPYQQAQLVVKYFPHLTPGAIRTYAEQVDAGTYKGWG